MDNYSNIGKAVLIRAIGLQKNHSILEKVDTVNQCESCPCKSLFDNAGKKCPEYDSCTEKDNITYVKKYINEKNKYGYAKKLGTNSIKLFLSYHTLHPDKNGIIMDVDLKEQAALLNVNIKTIKSCNSVLQEYGYISYAKTDTNTINVMLPEYSDYYKPATEGGRGFFVMSKELFYELLKIESLVMLRISIRQLLELDNLSIKGSFNVIEKTYRDLRLGLPQYCKPNVIRMITKKNKNDIFNIQINETSLRFVANDIFNAKKHKSDQEQQYIQMFTEFIKDFNTQVASINSNSYSLDDFTYKEFIPEEKIDTYVSIGFKELEIIDIAQLSMQYSFDKVIEAFSMVYKDYKLKDKHINNIGGLLRTIIISSYKKEEAAA